MRVALDLSLIAISRILCRILEYRLSLRFLCEMCFAIMSDLDGRELFRVFERFKVIRHRLEQRPAGHGAKKLAKRELSHAAGWIGVEDIVPFSNEELVKGDKSSDGFAIAVELIDGGERRRDGANAVRTSVSGA